jgi:hypothetical protein
MNPTAGPFARTAHQLHTRGWRPIPLADDKRPAVAGRTGHHGRNWTTYTLHRAIAHYHHHNVGIVLPAGTIALDVDHYNHKTGAVTIARLQRHLGDLPPTWHLRAEHRPPQSARFLYRVPVGRYTERTLAANGGHVELIQPHHRHTVAAGTIHHTAGLVRWYSPDCLAVDEHDAPAVTDLAELPDAWVQALTAPVPARTRRAPIHA